MPTTMKYRVTLFFLSLLAGSSAGGAAEIQFKSQAEVRGSLVLLSDIANIQDSDTQLVESLKRIELFPSPANGRLRIVRDVEIRQLLQLHGVRTADHRFSGAESVQIGHAKMPPKVTTVAAVSNNTTKSERPVVVAKHPITVGTVIRALDVELKVPDRPAATGAATESADSVVGHEATRSYTPGQVIDPRSLRKPILVRRGEAVAVVAKAAGVRVRTTAKALADGALGDLLPVEAENREKYTAVVTGSRQAEVFASGSSVTRGDQ